MSDSSTAAEMSSESSDESEVEQKIQIREDLKSMSFEEILKLKEELGAKVYKEAILGIDNNKNTAKTKLKSELKRLNKNRPREMSSKRQVPFLGIEQRAPRKREDIQIRDPRFDEKSGTYDVNRFKQDYKFVTKIRAKEINKMKMKLNEETDGDKRKNIKNSMQRLINKNVEDRKWHAKQTILKKDQQDIQKAHAEGKQPHYVTKKERRVKELVQQFVSLKETGKLNKHLEKRRKKNAAKDRKILNLE